MVHTRVSSGQHVDLGPQCLAVSADCAIKSAGSLMRCLAMVFPVIHSLCTLPFIFFYVHRQQVVGFGFAKKV